MLEHDKVVTIRPAQRRGTLVVVFGCLLLAATLLQLTVPFRSFYLAPFSSEDLSFIERSLPKKDEATTEPLSQGRKKEAVSPRHSGFDFDEFPRVDYVVYSQARSDRSGSVIQDMLMAHAYAFYQNWTYVGACGAHAVEPDRLARHESLVEVLGLQDVLVFHKKKCPPPLHRRPELHEVSLNVKHYRNSYPGKKWTQEWLNSFPQGPIANPRPDPSRRVVAHIRRGDVHPCGASTLFDRYQTNQYFLDMLSGYSPEEVTIYSELETAETWDVFAGYNLMLDTPIDEVWRGIVEAEVVILSKSTFSFVPALWNPRTVYYFPFWIGPPFPSWTVVDKKTVQQERANMKDVVNRYCSPEEIEAVSLREGW